MVSIRMNDERRKRTNGLCFSDDLRAVLENEVDVRRGFGEGERGAADTSSDIDDSSALGQILEGEAWEEKRR